LHYIPVHLQPYYRHMGFKEGQFPEAETYASSAISIPLYPGLEAQDQRRVVNTLSTLMAASCQSFA
jgi:dTDP-4-amino-4,6-dideoxygalactose transaminase